MRLIPSKYNDFLFQQSNRISADFVTPYDWGIGGLATNNIARSDTFPKYSGKVYGGGVKVVNVVLNCVDTDRDALVTSMDVRGSGQNKLYAKDKNGAEWYVYVTAVALNFQSTSGNTASFGYVFECDDPTWTKSETRQDVWDMNASGETHTITCGGNQPNYPVYYVGPYTSPANYYPYKQYIKNYNPIEAAQIDGIDITNGGWNTAALVAAGKMLASGDDCRVFCDGAEIPRWVGGGGWNSATTKIFVRLKWLPGITLTLRTAIAATGTPAKINFAATTANKAALTSLPVKGILRIGTEEFTYRNRNATAYTVDVVERSVRGTSAGVHAIGATTYWVEHDIKVVYGNASETAPVYSDVLKPVYDLATSTNTSRVYTVFADTANLRVGRWSRQIINDGVGNKCRLYSGNQGAEDEVDPATDMGIEIANFAVQGRWQPETADLTWVYSHPATITTVTSSGEKWRAFTGTTWPARAGLESSLTGAAPWVLEWNEATPGSAASWTAWTHNAEAVPTGTKSVRFRVFGSINALASNLARFEVDGVTIALNSSNIIQVAMNGEISSYQFSIQITNQTTGQSVTISYPVTVGRSLEIDTANLNVTYRGMNAFRGLTLDTIRTEILPLVPGDNVLEYTVLSPSTGDVYWVSDINERAL